VRREHRALRVAPHEVDQRAKRRPGVATRRLEALGDEDVARSPFASGARKIAAGLAIEWTLAIGEQRPHHPRVRAGEDVPDVVAVLLDDAPEGAVERRARAEDRLEPVEGDDHLQPGSLRRSPWKVEQREKPLAGIRVELRRDFHRRGLDRRLEAPKQSLDPRGQPALQAPVAQLEPRDRVLD